MSIENLSKEILLELVITYKNIIEKQGDKIKELETKYQQEFEYVEKLIKEKNEPIR
jgi:hypothetical protein